VGAVQASEEVAAVTEALAIIAPSVVAVAAIAANAWMHRQNQFHERRAWIRDRRAQTYIELLTLISKSTAPGQSPTFDEISVVFAEIRAFGSIVVVGLFDAWTKSFVSEDQTEMEEYRSVLESRIRTELLHDKEKVRDPG
jgi:hypothetical protein